MLKRDENKFCWYSNGKVGLPKDSIEEAIQDYLEEAKENGYSLDSVGIVNPLFLIHELSAKQAIFDVISFSLPQFMYDISSDYIAQDQLCIIKEVHIEELGKELSRVYNDWEKRHGYDKQSYIVFTDEAETYHISDYIK
jgi:hypothetical protein